MSLVKRLLVMGLLMILLIAYSGCTSEKHVEKTKIIIADQFGLAYAPLEVMKSYGLLEKELKNANLEVEIVWQKFGNTSSIREAMLSGGLDVGFVGIPPFLIGLDNGMDWKIFSGLSESQVSLIAKDSSIDGLADLTSEHRIILPQPGSIQHILLQMAAESQLGNYAAFDDQLVPLSHPDGVIAFESGGLEQLHFTAPPYISKDLNVNGARTILEGKDSVGEDYTFIVGICQREFYDQKAFYEAFKSALRRSIEEIQLGSDEILTLLSEIYEIPKDELKADLREKTISFSEEVKGLDRFSEFMFKTGTLSKVFTVEELVWE